MGKIKEKRYLYITAIIILIITFVMELVLVKIYQINWYERKYYIFRVLQEFSFMFICTLIFEDPSVYTKIREEIQLKTSYRRIQKTIFFTTVGLCLFNSLLMEVKRYEFWNGGTNIILAGAIAQYGNYFVRIRPDRGKRKLSAFVFVFVVFMFLYGVLYQWGIEINELMN